MKIVFLCFKRHTLHNFSLVINCVLAKYSAQLLSCGNFQRVYSYTTEPLTKYTLSLRGLRSLLTIITILYLWTQFKLINHIKTINWTQFGHLKVAWIQFDLIPWYIRSWDVQKTRRIVFILYDGRTVNPLRGNRPFHNSTPRSRSNKNQRALRQGHTTILEDPSYIFHITFCFHGTSYGML